MVAVVVTPIMVVGAQGQTWRQTVREADSESRLVAGWHCAGQFEAVARYAVQRHAQITAVLVLTLHLPRDLAENSRALAKRIVAKQAQRQAQ